MTGETVECYNCGRANPAWAQVCRSCGVPMRPGSGRSQASGPIPQDRDSLIAIGAGLGSIVLAIVVGLLLSGMIPAAAPVAQATPTPSPTRTPRPVPSVDASGEPSAEATPEPTPALIGTVSFGTGISSQTGEATGVTDTFTGADKFCHSISLTEPFGVTPIQEEVLRVEDDGSLTVVQERVGSNLRVNPDSQIAGFCSPGNTGDLIGEWGVGAFVLRDYRNEDTPELIAEGRFNLAR